MADPYTSVTVTDYNLNPPADDGSAVPSNQGTWAGVKTKLADPVKTALESINTNVGSAVDKLAGGITSVSDDYTVLASDQGKLIVETVAAKTITTLAAATAASPFRFGVLNNSSGDLTLEGNASETIDGAANVTIPSGCGVIIETDGSNWKTHGQNWVVRPIALFPPTGRLTLTSGSPVLSADVTAQATVYYTPYNGNSIMLYDGTRWVSHSFSELSQALSDTTKSPAAAAADSVYDMFVWNDSGTLRCTRGPAWSSATDRGTGAGTTELARTNGVLMNANAISNGPAAQRGVYVGTIATNGSTQLAMMFAPAAAAGGSANRLDVWNMYNRVDVASVCRDSTDTWTYTTATLRAANAAAASGVANRIALVRGLDEEPVSAEYNALGSNSAAGTGVRFLVGVGLDSTSAIAAGSVTGSLAIGDSAGPNSLVAKYNALPGIGLHFLQELEYSVAASTTTWYGDGGAPLITQSGMTLRTRM